MHHPQNHHRRSTRLNGYDYTQPGAYFVTVVTWQREALFGEIFDGAMCLSPAGEIAREEWFRTARLRANVRLEEDEFVVMPNHVHGIIWIVDGGVVGAQRRCAPTAPTQTITNTTNVPPNSLGAIVRAYKSAVTYRVNALGESRGAPLWQRNYYEHIIRDECEWRDIRLYIQTNPQCWVDDQLYPIAAADQPEQGR